MTSFQSFTSVASIVVLAGSVFLEFSVLLKDCAKTLPNSDCDFAVLLCFKKACFL